MTTTVSRGPRYERLPWPGLKSKDHICRLVTRAVKAAKESRETETWARQQMGKILEHVSVPDAMRLLVKVAQRGEQRRAAKRLR